MTGLPYGATWLKTLINLDADLDLLKLNMDLYRETGRPHMAWASTLIPYRGTVIAEYCVDRGFATEDILDDPRLGYHERSRLRHLNRWVGADPYQLAQEDSWLGPEEQEKYRTQNAFLRDLFHVFAYLKDEGALSFVRSFLEEEPLTIDRLNTKLKQRYPENYTRATQSLPDEASPILWAKVGGFCAVMPGPAGDLLRRFEKHLTDIQDVGLFGNIVKKYLFDTQVYRTNVECAGEVYHV